MYRGVLYLVLQKSIEQLFRHVLVGNSLMIGPAVRAFVFGTEGHGFDSHIISIDCKRKDRNA